VSRSSRAKGTKPAPIRDLDRVTDTICKVMAEGPWRDCSIDKLLTRPTDALRMALKVGVELGRLNNTAARRVKTAIDALDTAEVETSLNVNEILRAALAARKRGNLKLDRY
jgi:hypothetical protein